MQLIQLGFFFLNTCILQKRRLLLMQLLLAAAFLGTAEAGMFGNPACIAICQRRKYICAEANGFCDGIVKLNALNECIRDTPCAAAFRQCCYECKPRVLRYLFGRAMDDVRQVVWKTLWSFEQHCEWMSCVLAWYPCLYHRCLLESVLLLCGFHYNRKLLVPLISSRINCFIDITRFIVRSYCSISFNTTRHCWTLNEIISAFINQLGDLLKHKPCPHDIYQSHYWLCHATLLGNIVCDRYRYIIQVICSMFHLLHKHGIRVSSISSQSLLSYDDAQRMCLRCACLQFRQCLAAELRGVFPEHGAGSAVYDRIDDRVDHERLM